jgi:uncharacterized protein (TIGR03435 family)
MKTLCAFLMAIHSFLFGHLARFHAQPARPEFEVASVRPTPPSQEHGMSFSLQLDASQMRVLALPLRDIIAAAYRVKPYQVYGPDWITTTQFDISAKMPAGSKTGQVPDMLQSLLVDRFGLVFHREKKDLPVYALVIGKPPLKLHEPRTDAEKPAGPDTLTWSFSGNPNGVSNVLGGGSSYTFAGGKFDARKLTMSALAAELERYSPRPIIDMTQLSGTFDAAFTVTPEAYGQLLGRAAINSGMVIPPQMRIQIENSEFNALPEAVEQLGLKLDPRRMPVDVIAIDDLRRTPRQD